MRRIIALADEVRGLTAMAVARRLCVSGMKVGHSQAMAG
jgi:hypothetical protein